MSEFIFVIDPMCSWCWGFHPIIEELRKKYSATHNYTLVMGGLRTSGQMEWNNESKAYLKQNWDAVTQATNQPFSPQLLNRAEFDYFATIQEAFYTQGKDITDSEVLSTYVKEDKNAFLNFYHSDRAELLMQHDFSKARSMGANSFPSTVKIDVDGHMVCVNGYRGLEEILKV